MFPWSIFNHSINLFAYGLFTIILIYVLFSVNLGRSAGTFFINSGASPVRRISEKNTSISNGLIRESHREFLMTCCVFHSVLFKVCLLLHRRNRT